MTDLFYKLPQDLAARTDFPASAKIVYAVIVDFIGSNDFGWPSKTTLAEKTGLSGQAVLDSISRLEKAGFLVVERRGIGKVNHYKSGLKTRPVKNLDQSKKHTRSGLETRPEVVKNLDCIQTDPTNQTNNDDSSFSEEKISQTEQPFPNPTGEGQAGPEAQEGTEAGGDAGATAKGDVEPPVKKTAQKKKPPKDKKIPEGFDRFYAAYPRKEARVKAEEAWTKLKPDAERLETILDAVEIQKQSEQWQKDGGKFIPYPASWLNGRRWEDETEPAGGGDDSIENGDWTPNFEERQTILEMARRSGWPEPVFEGATA